MIQTKLGCCSNSSPKKMEFKRNGKIAHTYTNTWLAWQWIRWTAQAHKYTHLSYTFINGDNNSERKKIVTTERRKQTSVINYWLTVTFLSDNDAMRLDLISKNVSTIFCFYFRRFFQSNHCPNDSLSLHSLFVCFQRNLTGNFVTKIYRKLNNTKCLNYRIQNISPNRVLQFVIALQGTHTFSVCARNKIWAKHCAVRTELKRRKRNRILIRWLFAVNDRCQYELTLKRNNSFAANKSLSPIIWVEKNRVRFHSNVWTPISVWQKHMTH